MDSDDIFRKANKLNNKIDEIKEIEDDIEQFVVELDNFWMGQLKDEFDEEIYEEIRKLALSRINLEAIKASLKAVGNERKAAEEAAEAVENAKEAIIDFFSE